MAEIRPGSVLVEGTEDTQGDQLGASLFRHDVAQDEVQESARRGLRFGTVPLGQQAAGRRAESGTATGVSITSAIPASSDCLFGM